MVSSRILFDLYNKTLKDTLVVLERNATIQKGVATSNDIDMIQGAVLFTLSKLFTINYSKEQNECMNQLADLYLEEYNVQTDS